MEETLKTVCNNPWCKATFTYKDDEKIIPTVCPKCKSFDTELSGGVEWKDKKYEGSRFDDMAHETKYSINYTRK